MTATNLRYYYSDVSWRRRTSGVFRRLGTVLRILITKLMLQMLSDYPDGQLNAMLNKPGYQSTGKFASSVVTRLVQ